MKETSQFDPVIEKLLENGRHIRVLEAQLQALSAQILAMKKPFSPTGTPKATGKRRGRKLKRDTLKESLAGGRTAIPEQAEDKDNEGFYSTVSRGMRMQRNDNAPTILSKLVAYMEKTREETLLQREDAKNFEEEDHAKEKIFNEKLLNAIKKLKVKPKKVLPVRDEKGRFKKKTDMGLPPALPGKTPKGATTPKTTPAPTGAPPTAAGPSAIKIPKGAPATPDVGFAARATKVAGDVSKLGLTNPIAMQAFLQVASKESGLKGVSEYGAQAWANTIRNKNEKEGPGAGVAYANKIFGKNFTEQQYMDAASKGDEYFFGPNFMSQYSGGWKYRGRGYVGLTHDYNYRNVSKIIGKDILSDPDLVVRDSEVNAQASLAVLALSIGQGDYNKGLKILNSFDDKQKAITFITANIAAGGTGLNENRVSALMEKGHFQNALSKAQSYENAVSTALNSTKFAVATPAPKNNLEQISVTNKDSKQTGAPVVIMNNTVHSVNLTQNKQNVMMMPKNTDIKPLHMETQ